jgi:hypothetical protein
VRFRRPGPVRRPLVHVREEHDRTVEDAKTDETRQRRIAKILAGLQAK